MKRIKLILSLLVMFNMISCMDMFNEIAEDFDRDYNYYLAIAQSTSGGQTQVYGLDSSGMITTLKGTLNNAPTMYPPVIAAHPTGGYLFIPYFSGTGWLGSYKINDDASLTLADSDGLASIISIAVHPTGKYLYCAAGGVGEISEYSINADGTITAIGETQTEPTGQCRIAVSPAGDFVYIGGTGSSSKIYIYPVNADGTLSSSTTTNAIGGSPTIGNIKISSNGSVYCTTSSTGIFLYNDSDNTLYSQGTYGSGTNGFIAIHPSGKYLYVSGGSTCYIFNVNSNDTLTYLTSSSMPGTINEMLFHPNGELLYVTAGNYIYSYAINSDGTVQSQLQNISSSYADGLALIRKKK